MRARRFVPQEAFKQFKDTEDWRKENKLDEIFETIEVEEFEQTRRLVQNVLMLVTATSDSLAVSPMARSTRQARHSALPVRSCAAEHEEHIRIREELGQIEDDAAQRPDQECPVVRAVRIADQIRDAAVLYGSPPTP